MQYLKDSGFNILILGRWNPSIFSPQWVRANVAGAGDEVMLALPIGNPAAPLRISFAGVQLFTAPDFLEIKPSALDDASIDACARVADNILALLSHTPITAIGVNVRFEDAAASTELDPLFLFPDQGLIDPVKYPVISSSVARCFDLGQQDLLNLTVTQQKDNYVLEFNFHTDSQDIEVVRSRVSPNCVRRRLEQARDFLKDTYNATIEE